ncbi:MAG: metal-dependent phosphohydrolase [Planctomyces sp.]|nr:metal-dependent phosphohydrolase [Planctomyces sp.]
MFHGLGWLVCGFVSAELSGPHRGLKRTMTAFAPSLQDFADLSTGEFPSQRLIEPGKLRLSELISALSVALDLTEGQPAGHAARSCIIGMKIAEQLQLPQDQLVHLYYALLLKDLGCSSNAAKMCYLFGADERQIKHDLKSIDWTRMQASVSFSWAHVAPEASPLQKILKVAALFATGPEGARRLVETRCERGATIARDLGFSEQTALAIRSLDEHWNGKGQPDGLKGEEIPLLARILGISQTVEVFFQLGGAAKVSEIVRERRGTWFDPQLVDIVLKLSNNAAFWESVATRNALELAVQWEVPDEIQYVDDDFMDRVCFAFASVVDAKSPWTFNHSNVVAHLSRDLAKILGFDEEMQRDMYRAGLLHDLGKLGVSNAILDKPGKPTDEEFAAIRKHPDFSEKILLNVPRFQQLADVAAAHHERMDGKGYHRRLVTEELPLHYRILAVADVYDALTAKRPYRDAMPLEKVMAIMDKDSGTSFAPEVVQALHEWIERNNPQTRVPQQLEAVDRLVDNI